MSGDKYIIHDQNAKIFLVFMVIIVGEESKGIYSNAQMTSRQLRQICVFEDEGRKLLKNAMEKLNLSARAYDRILKVARTIADLDTSTDINSEHLAEAIQYRSLDRENWGG